MDKATFSVRRPAALIAAAALLGTAACSSSSGAGASATSPTTSPTAVVTTTTVTTAPPPAGTTPPGTPTSVAPTTPAVPAGPASCVESQLRASVDPRAVPGNGTAGSDGHAVKGVIIDFRNTSSSTCVLSGYPGAAVADSSGRQVVQATRTLRGALTGLPSSDTSAPSVTLTPGSYAAAGVEGVDQHDPGTAQAGCAAAPNPRILITPPNTRTAVPFDVSWPVCYSFTVHPVQALPDAPQ